MVMESVGVSHRPAILALEYATIDLDSGPSAQAAHLVGCVELGPGPILISFVCVEPCMSPWVHWKQCNHDARLHQLGFYDHLLVRGDKEHLGP